MEYYLAIKLNEIMSFARSVDETGDQLGKQLKPDSGQTSYADPHMWKLDIKGQCAHKYMNELVDVYI
jgi:hypothetical protein